jgi:hypothetical protein
MSAIAESSDAHEMINVLFALHPDMDALDFCGPLEVLSATPTTTPTTLVMVP